MSNSKNKQPLLDLTDDVKVREKNNIWGIPGISQPDVTTTPPIIDPMGFLLGYAKKGGDHKKQCPPTICKVSRVLRDHSESPYNPQLVSIGPIHREDPKLQEFEWLKECYLDDLLHRCRVSTPQKRSEAFEACLQKVNTSMKQIRESYAGVKKKYSDAELATMMVIDGCFILEFCFKHKKPDLYLPNKMQNNRIAMDLMLLENQVPFFVLQDLFDCLAMDLMKAPFTLSKLLDKCLAYYIELFRLFPEKKSILSNIPTTPVDSSTHDHVLGYLHKRYQLVAAKSSKPIHAEASKPVDEEQAAGSSKPIQAEASKPVDEEQTAGSSDIKKVPFHSIVELDRSGMNFKPHQESPWSMNMRFQSSLFSCLPWFKPTLLMPTLVVDDTTELILRNFIAYEQSFPQDRYYFTSYAYAMDKLIDTQEDMAKLVESKVLVNMLGSNQEAAEMINKICKNINITKFYYTQEFNEIDKYYNALWPKNIARLRRTYFNNPWSAIALVAAIILFTLTVVQTVYTIRAA